MSPSPGGPDTTATRSGMRWSSLTWQLAILIISLLAATALVTALYAASTVRTSAEENNAESMANVHRSVSQTLVQTGVDVERYRDTALTSRKDLLRELTNAQLESMTKLNDAVGRGEMSLATAQEIAAQTLYDFRYGADDYFFAFTPNMVSIVEPNPTFRGDMLDYTDANGKAFFREFQSVALGPGAGYVDYVGTRVGETEPSPKTSYVAYFEPWEWVVGTGVYLDDIDAEAQARLKAAEADLSITLDDVRFAETGFFFVVDQTGAVVVTPASKDLSGVAATEWGQQLAAELVAAAAPADDVMATLSADASYGGDDQRWRFGVSEVEPLDWVLVSAVPEAELTAAANRLALRQLILSAVVLAIGLAIGLLTSRRIVRPVQDLTAAAVALEEDRFEPSSLDAAAERRDEVGGLARAFRRMAAEVVERERALRARVTRLEVVIDKSKVDDEITAITDSDFFRNLERQAAKMRESWHEGGEASEPSG